MIVDTYDSLQSDVNILSYNCCTSRCLYTVVVFNVYGPGYCSMVWIHTT